MLLPGPFPYVPTYSLSLTEFMGLTAFGAIMIFGMMKVIGRDLIRSRAIDSSNNPQIEADLDRYIWISEAELEQKFEELRRRAGIEEPPSHV